MNKNEFQDIVEKSIDILSTDNLKDNLTKTIENNTNLDFKKSQKLVNDIADAIELVDKNYKDLKKAKENGKTRTQWLQDKVDMVVKDLSSDAKNKFIQEIKTNLDISNNDMLIEVFDETVDLSKKLPNSKYEDLNKKVIIDDFNRQLKDNTVLGAIINEDGKFKIDTKHKEIKAVKEYFEAKLDSDYDKQFKTAISVATDIAKNKNLLPPSLKDKTPEEISMIVDKGVTSVKVAYKLANGELNAMDAVEYTIDRNTAILNSAIVTATTKYGGIVGGKVGGFIGSIFGPAGTVAGTAIGTVVGKFAGSKVGEFINTGVKKVASVAKSVASSVVSGVKSVVSSVGNAISSACSSVASFFGF
jgi:outer membrane lipoprotein SlyB